MPGLDGRSDGAEPGADPADVELVRHAQGGDAAAFEDLLGRYEDRAYRLAQRFVRNESDAREVLQEAFLSAWRGMRTLRDPATFGRWLLQVTARSALMLLRRRRRHPETSADEMPEAALDRHMNEFAPLLDAAATWARRPDEQALSEELRAHVAAAVDRLSDGNRMVFVLRDLEGLSTEDVAETLGITEATVKTRLHRARLALQREIAGYFQAR